MAYEQEEAKGNDAFDNVVRQAQQNSREESSDQGRQRPEGVSDLKIILWGNGFQVGDDGPFRDKNAEENKQFIEELQQGVVPREIRGKYPNGVSVGLEDKRSQ